METLETIWIFTVRDMDFRFFMDFLKCQLMSLLIDVTARHCRHILRSAAPAECGIPDPFR